MIRFADEIIEMQDFCQFRTEFDIEPKPTPDLFSMEVELLFSEIANVGQPDLISDSIPNVMLACI